MKLIIAFSVGVIMAGQLLGRTMASIVDENRSQQCAAGVVTRCDER